MYVARERKSVSPSLMLYTKKPVRDYKYDPGGLWVSDGDSIPLPPGLFPDLRWEDEPLEVDITLTPKHNNCLPGIFTVNANGKKVKFSPGNLFWDGSKFGFEKHQYDFPTKWNPEHVGHFFWSKDANIARAEDFEDGNQNVSDRFFAADDGAVDGYTVLSKYEWDYLIGHSLAKNSLGKNEFTINGKACIIFKPDGFNGTVKGSYSAEEWATAETSGLVALPFAGYRNGAGFYDAGSGGIFWSATPYDSGYACCADFDVSVADTCGNGRGDGSSVRLVSVQ